MTGALQDRSEGAAAALSSRFASLRLKGEALLAFFNQFYYMVKAGVPLFQALELVLGEVEDRRFRALLEEVRHELTEGKSFSDALSAYPHLFTPLEISMLVIGENTGHLDEAFQRIAQSLEEEIDLKKKVRKALAYPLFTLGVGLMILGVMIVVVFPRFAALFRHHNLQLPAITRAFMALSEFIGANTATLGILGAGGTIGIVVAWRGSIALRSAVAALVIRLPLWGRVQKETLVLSLSRDLGTMLASGIPLVDSLSIACRTLGNQAFVFEIERALERVREGDRLADAFRDSVFFPRLVLQLIQIGEATGQLDQMMKNVHEYYKKRVDQALARFTAAIGPSMTVLIGVIVALLAVSLYVPMFQLTEALKRR